MVALRAAGLHIRRAEDALAIGHMLRSRVTFLEDRKRSEVVLVRLAAKASNPTDADKWSLINSVCAADRRVGALGFQTRRR